MTGEETVRLAASLEYDGTDFAGSQFQPGRRTVAGELAACLARLDPAFHGPPQLAGRTDAGVHARGQVAAFTTHRTWGEDEWAHRLNRLLPADVAVRRIARVAPGFDPRRDALWRVYRYRASVGSERPVLGRREVGWYPGCADPQLAQAAIVAIAAAEDWEPFRAPSERTLPAGRVTFRLDVSGADWRFEVGGRAFGYRQVRLMVGAVMAVAGGAIRLAELAQELAAGRRHRGVVAAPATGLCLERVEYPAGVLDVRE